MVEKTIGDLTAAGTMDGTELLEIQQSGNSRRATAAEVAAFYNGSGTYEPVDAEILRADTDDNLTAGYTATADNDGTKSSGTYTPDPAGGNLKYITANGAFTLAAPTASGDYTIIIQITNGASAGTITFSGFAASGPDGDAYTTTNGDDFMLFITKINGFVLGTLKALQ